MPVNITTPDYFEMNYLNFVAQAYEKNGSCNIGQWFRNVGIGYSTECLVKCDVSGIPAGSIVTGVTIDFDIVANTLVGNQTMVVAEQDTGGWTDTGSLPVFDNPFSVNNPWPAALSSLGGLNGGSSGTQTIPTSAGLVSLFQDFVDGVKTDADGVILQMNTATTAWHLDIDTITVNVTYTEPVSRRVFIVD